MKIPPERLVEWAAEKRILTRERQRIERRLEELDEILKHFGSAQ